ncbi:MAG TPA: DUF1292 domain-containing protein [Clostridiales bacterium]|nr:DUF1292 domain-containing protein [Clostridiales bacterium]
MEHNEDLIYLTDENGNDSGFALLGTVEHQSKEYAVLLPVEGAELESSEEGEVVILQVERIPGEECENLITVDSQEELDQVFALFCEKYRDEYQFT